MDLAFKNGADRPVALYCVDRWGSWVWTGRMPRGGEMRLRSFKGQWWKATGPKGGIRMNYQAGNRDDTVVFR